MACIPNAEGSQTAAPTIASRPAMRKNGRNGAGIRLASTASALPSVAMRQFLHGDGRHEILASPFARPAIENSRSEGNSVGHRPPYLLKRKQASKRLTIIKTSFRDRIGG
jgi:hypothetical protein